VLVRELSLDLVPGARGLVVGPQDATVALERAIAGMWPSGSGKIIRPNDLMFLPERPYLPPGSLRHLLVGMTSTGSDGDLWEALRAAGVEAAVRRVGGIDVAVDWDNDLSLEEQRLLEIARMLLAAPAFVVLMRLAANLGVATAVEARAALSARGIGYLALETEAAASDAQCDAVVQIAPDGTWSRIADKAATG
jgi:putative ATP-binding cassette transporter